MVCSLLVFSCKKPNNEATYESTGTISGQDIRMCPCCGGYFITIGDTQYHFEKSELPANFTFSDDQLPLQVQLDWELKTASCSDFKWIKISRIKKD